MKYKLLLSPFANQADRIALVGDASLIVFGIDNKESSTYQTFKKEVLAGAELQDADGNVMTQEQANEFIKELP
jgi:hypothetical protein